MPGCAPRPRLAILCARRPAPGGKGDQLRAHQFASALAASHDVTVLHTDATASPGGGPAAWDEVVIARGRLRRAIGALGALLRGQPLQVGYMMPSSAWRVLRREAEQADVVVAVTVRALRGPLRMPLIVDHVDALSVNMRRRSRGPEHRAARLVFALEARLLARYERRVAGYCTAQIVISAADAEALPAIPQPRVIPNAVDIVPTNPGLARDIDVIFTGGMRYPPNLDAAQWLRTEIFPAVLRRRPTTSLAVVGRDAASLEPWDGVQISGDVPDLAAHIARARVAVVPLRLGTGAANKVLEAIATGAVVVGTRAALRPFDLPPDAAIAADDGEEIAAAIVGLLDDPRRLDAMRAAASERLVDFTPAALAVSLDEIAREAAR